jgi:hypothetical protein
MNSTAKNLIGITLLGLSFTAGYIFGVRDGVYQFQFLNGATKAGLLSKELRVLRTGQGEKLIPSKEIKLDSEIAAYSIMKEKGRPWIFWPESSVFDHDTSIGIAVAYRREFPSPLTEEFTSQMMDAETKDGIVEMAERVNAVVSAHEN